MDIVDEVMTQGYGFAEGYRPEADIVAIAAALGKPLMPWTRGLIQELVPRASATPNTYSGMYGLQRFPFHTDLAHWPLPPRYLLLRCINGHEDIPTLLLDGRRLIDFLTPDILKRAIFKQRRPRNGSLSLLRLYAPAEVGDLLRWDQAFIKPASKIGDIADRQIRCWLAQADPSHVALARRGDILLVDNWRMLHARPSIPAGRQNRKIERIYLESLH